MKSLFGISAEAVTQAAKLVDGRERYKLLLSEVEGRELVSFPPITLSNNKKIILTIPYAEFVSMVQRHITEIEESLDVLGVTYE